MEGHLSNERLAAYSRRALPPEELLAADDHLAACDECRARLGAPPPGALADALRPQEPEGHVEHERLAALVDGALDDVERELVLSHLEGCPRCAADAQDLRAARSELRLDHEYAPARRLSPVESAARRRPAESVLRLAAVLALALGGYWLLRAPEGATPEPRPEGSPAGIALDDGGGLVRYDAQGGLQGLDADGAWQTKVAEAVRTRRVAVADVSDLQAGPERLMGSAALASFGVVAPVGTVVESRRPLLRWRGLGGSSSYRVTILATDLTPAAESPELSVTEWAPVQELERGRTYVWQVAALKNGKSVYAPAPPLPEARFRVLDEARAQALVAARARRPSHLLRAVAYAEAGLLDEAKEELAALLALNPQSALARELSESLAHAQSPSPTTTKPAQ